MAEPAGTSNTPPAVAPAAAPATPSVTPVAAAPPAPAITPEPASPSAPATASPAPTAAPTAETAPTPNAAPVPPAFTLPTDMKLAPEAVEKFQHFVTSKSPGTDGKFSLTAQELVDVFATQARDASQRWQTEMQQQDTAWAAESKARYSPAQLAAAETGVGFLTSYEPQFRELAKSFRNNPAFVNAMRVIGERLSEDEFVQATQPPKAAKRSRTEIFYPAKTN